MRQSDNTASAPARWCIGAPDGGTGVTAVREQVSKIMDGAIR